MSDSSGFIDLRVGQGGRGVGDESVWPSFTDIMTVIVMIFLMALVVIMVRNFELDRELMSTISAKEQTTLANQGLSEQLASLETSLNDTQVQRDTLQDTLAKAQVQRDALQSDLTDTLQQRDSLQSELQKELQQIALLSANQADLKTELNSVIETREKLQLQNQELQSQKQQGLLEVDRLLASEESLRQTLDTLSEQFSEFELNSNEQIDALSADKLTLSEKLDTVSQQLAEVKELLKLSETDGELLSNQLGNLKLQNQSVEEKYTIATEEILALTELIQQREAENIALQQQADTRILQYQSLQQEFESLDEKYRDLVRPARSTAGKYVVEVLVEKNDNGLQYKLREPEDAERRNLNKSQLDATLLELKNRFTGSLYTRIIIPENSRLTHNEAWEFTQEILNKYDYYYQ